MLGVILAAEITMTNVSGCLLVATTHEGDKLVRAEVYNQCKDGTVFLHMNKDGFVDAARCTLPGSLEGTFQFCTEKDGRAVPVSR